MRKPQRNSKKFRTTPHWAEVTTALTPTHPQAGLSSLPFPRPERHCSVIGCENSLLSVWFPCSPAHLRGCYLLNWSYLREWVYFDRIWLSHLNLRVLGLVRSINTISSSKNNKAKLHLLSAECSLSPGQTIAFALLSCLLLLQQMLFRWKAVSPSPRAQVWLYSTFALLLKLCQPICRHI